MLALTLRLVFSLLVVLGLLAVLARMAGRRYRGGKSQLINVVNRQQLSRSSSLSVVTVGGRVLCLGITDHEIRLLTELDPEDIVDQDLLTSALGDDDLDAFDGPHGEGAELHDITALARRPSLHLQAVPDSPLAGSVLSLETWRQAVKAARRRTS